MYPDYLLKIREVIHAVARQEDSELRRYSGKGILLMPELAFVHQVAKELSLRCNEVFNTPNIQWEMNKNFGAGLTDLIIIPQGIGANKIAFEFKIGGGIQTWIDDIDKINQLDSNEYDRIFVSLIDVFVNDLMTHCRIKDIDQHPSTIRIGNNFDFFTTVTNYVTQTCCVVGTWFIQER